MSTACSNMSNVDVARGPEEELTLREDDSNASDHIRTIGTISPSSSRHLSDPVGRRPVPAGHPYSKSCLALSPQLLLEANMRKTYGLGIVHADRFTISQNRKTILTSLEAGVKLLGHAVLTAHDGDGILTSNYPMRQSEIRPTCSDYCSRYSQRDSIHHDTAKDINWYPWAGTSSAKSLAVPKFAIRRSPMW